MRTPRVLLITDAAFLEETVLAVVEVAAKALGPGELAVQLRDKERPASDRAAWAATLRRVTRALEVPLVIHGDVALARHVDADGVHFPGGASRGALASATGLWRSMAAHEDAEVVAARAAKVDAVLVSPIFATPGKGEPRGVGALTRASELAAGEVAVLALGGIEPDRVRACVGAGAHGVAVIRALLGATEPSDVARAFAKAFAAS